MRTTTTITLALSLLTGCTTWSTTTSLGPVQEVGRRAKGQPSLVTTSSSSVAGGVVGMGTGPLFAGGFAAGTESHTRTRCVQDVDIAYEQPFEIHPVEVGRSKDRLAGIALIAGGVLMFAAGLEAASDPYSTASPEAGYAVGGALAAGGVGLLVYSYTSLPREPRPEVSKGVNRWVATQTLDAEGCAVPSSVAQTPNAPVIINNAPTSTPSATERLRTLDRLRESGTISDAEYKRKRAEIVDGI